MHAALGPVAVGTAPPPFSQSLVSTADPDPYELAGAKAGPDDRLAAVWHEQLGCWNESGRPQRHVAAYTTPGLGFKPTGPGVPGPPATFKAFWWLADGRLLFWTQTSSPFRGQPDDLRHGRAGHRRARPRPGSATPRRAAAARSRSARPAAAVATPPPIVTVPRVRTTFKASSDGTVKVTVVAPGPGDLAIELLAKRSGLIEAEEDPARAPLQAQDHQGRARETHAQALRQGEEDAKDATN